MKHTSIVRIELVALVILSALGCGGPTDPQLNDLLEHRASWEAHGLSKYAYEYEQIGFFNNIAGRVIRLVIIGNTVQTAVFVSNGQPVPGEASAFPTIDALFAQAEAAAQNHALTAISFDPLLGYPVQMDLAGPPDASGSILASNLQPLP